MLDNILLRNAFISPKQRSIFDIKICLILQKYTFLYLLLRFTHNQIPQKLNCILFTNISYTVTPRYNAA